MTSNPAHYCISVKQEPHGAAGRYLRERVQVGDTLDTAAPRGEFVLRQGPQPVVLLSAGIGVTPVPAMLRALAESASTRSQAAGPVHAPPGDPGTGPLVSFARSGLTVNWNDRYASLIELAEACNVRTRFAYRTGVCHTCITRLVDGTVAYRPEPLERPGKDNVLICCSQPTVDVVIDI